MADTLAIMNMSPVIPVVTVQFADQAVTMARALYDGGIKTIEITRRTPAAMAGVRAVAEAVPDLCLGVGTVWDGQQAREAHEAGAQFMVSPGIADEVGDVCRECNTPWLPGAQTTSEIAHLVRQGWTQVKLFPASVVGGPAAIKAYGAVFPQVNFCPTGGVNEDNAPDYLSLANIPCVGGSWLTKSSDYETIRAAAERAARLGS